MHEAFNIFLQQDTLFDPVTNVIMVLAKPQRVPFARGFYDEVRRLCDIVVLLDLVEDVGFGEVEGTKFTSGSPMLYFLCISQ